jgi:glycine cleavage system H protein
LRIGNKETGDETMAVPNELYYAKTHEWLRMDDGVATVGITDFAQGQLSDITFVELPDVGREVEAGDEVAVVESVKAASDIYAPAAGTVVEVNSDLEDAPELINNSPYEDGWLFRIELRKEEDVDNLMSAEEYIELCSD